MAGKSLHSHLVGCATVNPVESAHRFVIYVPIRSTLAWNGPLDGRLFLLLSLLYPDLPFLVCPPTLFLGCQGSSWLPGWRISKITRAV